MLEVKNSEGSDFELLNFNFYFEYLYF